MGRTADRLGRLLLRLSRNEGRAARTLRVGRRFIPALMDVAVGRSSLGPATLVRAVF